MVQARTMEFVRDRANLTWSLIFPVVLVAGLALAFSGDGERVFKIGTRGEVAPVLKVTEVEEIPYGVGDEALVQAEKKLLQHMIDLLVDLEKQELVVNKESQKSTLSLRIFQEEFPTYKTREVRGQPIRYLDWVVPGVIGMNMLFSCLFGVGYVLVRYRKNGVLKRMKATPVGAFTFLSAQALSRLLIVLGTSTLVFFGTNLALGFTMKGSWFDLFLYYALGVFSIIALGLVVASRFKNEEVTNGILNLIIFPMVILSQVFFSLEGAPDFVQTAASFLPLSPIISGARQIMLEGAGLGDLWPQMLYMGGLTAAFLTLGAWLFRWD